MLAPNDRLYTKDHLWIKPLDKGIVIGITDFAQAQLDDIVYVELPDVGAVIRADGFVAGIQHHTGMFELHSPVGGEILSVNEHLNEEPETLNEDPYDTGWIALLKPQGKKMPAFLSAKEYTLHLSKMLEPNDDE